MPVQISKLFFCFGLILFSSLLGAQTAFDHLAKLDGSWKGQLTYLDYTSGKPFTMKANLDVKVDRKNERLFLKNSYPNEPNANSIDTLKFSAKKKLINNEKIFSVAELKDSSVVIIVTEEKGLDGNDNKKAEFRYTYRISASRFSKKKEVKFENTKDWIVRHEYIYNKG